MLPVIRMETKILGHRSFVWTKIERKLPSKFFFDSQEIVNNENKGKQRTKKGRPTFIFFVIYGMQSEDTDFNGEKVGNFPGQWFE